MSKPVSLIPLRANDIAVGAPLPWPVYDWHGKLLLAKGNVIENETQLRTLTNGGFVRDPTVNLDFSPPRVSAEARREREKEEKAEQAAKESLAANEVVAALDEIHWYVGETFYLQLLDKPSIRYTVKLIGFVPHKTVLVTAPAADGKYEFIREGQSFVIRAFAGKKAYAFIASAVKSVHAPHPYLHLSYPKQVRCTVVRQGIRTTVSLIASLSVGEAQHTGAALITDLSVGGASAMAKEALGTTGDIARVKFKLTVAGEEEILNVAAVLRSVAQMPNGEGVRHGLEFVDLPAKEKIVLTAFVHQAFVESQ